MRPKTFLLISAAASWAALAQQSTPPQRTITTRPDSTVSSDAKPASVTATNPSAALEQYRQMWQKMTPAQQAAIVRAGGVTPEQFERTLMGRGPALVKGANAASAADPRAADSGSLDALSKSLQDLNAVRDGNLSLVQKDGCAPELASRIADLKAKLRSDEFELNGAETASALADPHTPEKASAGNAADPMAVAGDWFKHSADTKASARPDDSARTRESALLDAVLAGAQAPAPPERRMDPKSPEAEQNRKAIEADMARVKSELEQLSGACAAKK